MNTRHLELGRESVIRLLVLASPVMQGQIRRQLAPIRVTIDFIAQASELSHLALSQTSYDVALLPAVLPDNGWWSIWGEITLLHPRPEIVVYARAPSFQLWSGVLELGGHDVLVEPFTAEELRRAVTHAAASFAERSLPDSSSNGE